VLWLGVLCYFRIEFFVISQKKFVKSFLFLKILKFHVIIAFCVFWISRHMIQQLLCFQICQSKIFNKLGNVVLKFLKIGKISVLIFILFFWVESDHMVVGYIPINW